MAWYDYVPGVSNVAGAIKGDWEQAAGGAGVAGIRKGAGYMGLDGVNTDGLEADADFMRQQRAAYAQKLNGLAPRDVPQVGAAQAAPAGMVTPAQATAERTGPIERVTAPQLERTADVNTPFLGDAARGVSAQIAAPENVGAATIAPVTQAQAARIDTSAADQTRTDQRWLTDELQAAVRGERPSVAQLQLRDNLGAISAQQQSLAAAAPVSQMGAARRRAAREIARAGVNTNAQAAQLRAQEIAAARGQLGGVVRDTRDQDIGLATTGAGLQQQTNLANAGAANTRGLSQAQLEQEARQSHAGRLAQRALAQAGQDTTVSMGNAAAMNNRDTARAGLQAEIAQGNAGRTQQTNLAQGQLTQGANLANQGAFNDSQQKNADRSTAVSQTNTAQQNTVNTQNADRTTDVNKFNTQQTNTVGTQNAERTITARGQDDTRESSLRGDVAAANNSATGAEAVRTGAQDKVYERRANLVKSGAEAAPMLAAMSDKDAKRDIKPEPKYDVEAFLRAVKPSSYDYKDNGPGTAPGRRVGTLLDVGDGIDTTALGKSFTVSTERGKMIDAGQSIGPLLVIAKHLNEKIDAIAGQRRKAAKEMRA